MPGTDKVFVFRDEPKAESHPRSAEKLIEELKVELERMRQQIAQLKEEVRKK